MGFLHHERDATKGHDDVEVEIDDGLESRILDVETAVSRYLSEGGEASRAALADALGSLDAATTASDTFRSQSWRALTLGAPMGIGSADVIGQTSRFPIVEEVPATVFQAQVALVRAAKDELAATSIRANDALIAARDALDDARRRAEAIEATPDAAE